MGRMMKERSVKSGLPPGTLVHIGEKSDREVCITAMEYGPEGCTERTVATLGECLASAGTGRVTWVNVEGLHEVEAIRKLGECHGLHPLVLEDIVNTDLLFRDPLPDLLRSLPQGNVCHLLNPGLNRIDLIDDPAIALEQTFIPRTKDARKRFANVDFHMRCSEAVPRGKQA